MSKDKDSKRKTIRGRINKVDKFFHCLYGSLYASRYVKAYCTLHECYLSADNIREKECNKKHCKYLKEVDVSKQPK